MEILSLQRVPGAAYRWCSGNPRKVEGISFPLQGWRATDAVTGVIFFSCYFPVVAGGREKSSLNVLDLGKSSTFWLRMQERVWGNTGSFKLDAIR